MNATVMVTQEPRGLGPLLTTFTPPSACFSYGGHFDTVTTEFMAQGCSNGNVVDTTSCWPTARLAPPAPPFYGWGFYSLGTICPSGYTTACTMESAYNGLPLASTFLPPFDFRFALAAGEAAVGCCPQYVAHAMSCLPFQPLVTLYPLEISRASTSSRRSSKCACLP